MIAFSNLLLHRFGGDFGGIVRGCAVGGQSEHKEGRAFDWTLNPKNRADQRAGHRAFKFLTSDSHGVQAYNAHRLGVMYLIWHGHIWRGYEPERGWQPYTGADAHASHMHISLTWSGAEQETSWYTRHPVLDYGPCQKIQGQLAHPYHRPRLTPCRAPETPLTTGETRRALQAGSSLLLSATRNVKFHRYHF